MTRLFLILAVLLGTLTATGAERMIENDIVVFDVWDYFQREHVSSIEERADILYFLTCLQGVVNRDQPQLYLYASVSLFDVETQASRKPGKKRFKVTDIDRYWMKYFQKKGWVDRKQLIKKEGLDDVIEHFYGSIHGLTLWTMELPATSNIACMSASAEDLLPVSADLAKGKFREWLDVRYPELKVKLDLTDRFDGKKPILIDGKKYASTGSAKNDAYRFAIEKWQKPGKLDPFYLWYNCDACMFGKLRKFYGGAHYKFLGDKNELQQGGMYNSDFWVAKRGFFLDLLPWDDTTPSDDPKQPVGADCKTWNDILENSYKQRDGEWGLCGGFVPWWIKYTKHTNEKHGAVATEWQFIALLTSYNLVNEGDAAFGIANASFFMHLPQVSQKKCKPIPPKEEVKWEDDAVYLCFYMMDYDGSAWVNQMVPPIWDDRKRGEIPLNWTINPIMHRRIPHVFHYLYETRSPNDTLGLSDDGVGYISPLHLSERIGRIKESGIESYEAFARKIHDRYGITNTAFYITTKFTSPWIDMAARIDPSGYGYHTGREQMVGDTPVAMLRTFHIGSPDQMYREMDQAFSQAIPGSRTRPGFRAYRCILCPPSLIVDAVRKAQKAHPDAKIRIVDTHNYYRLLKKYLTLPMDTRFQNVPEVSASPRMDKGLTPVGCADGVFTIETEQGTPCWMIPAGHSGSFLYFDVSDAFALNADPAVEVIVEYLDQGKGRVRIQYNCEDHSLPHGGAYKETVSGIQRENSCEWKSYTFKLTDAQFDNLQNSGADLRIANNGDALRIRKITIRK